MGPTSLAPSSRTGAVELIDRLADLFRAHAGRWRVRMQAPLAVSDISEPEPDLAVDVLLLRDAPVGGRRGPGAPPLTPARSRGCLTPRVRDRNRRGASSA